MRELRDVVIVDGCRTAVGKMGGSLKPLKAHELATAVLKNDLQSMKDGLDVNKIGGTALLGISRPVIKAHGSSNEEAIFSAIRQAVNFSRAGVIEEIEKNIEHMRLDPEEAAEMEETK